MNRLSSARASGRIEYAVEQQRTDPCGYAERALASAGDSVPPEIRNRIGRKIRDYRARHGQASAMPTEPIDLTTDKGRKEHVDRLVAEAQADRLLEGI